MIIMKVIRSVIRITLIYVQTLKHGDIMFEHKSKQDIYIYIYIYISIYIRVRMLDTIAASGL